MRFIIALTLLIIPAIGSGQPVVWETANGGNGHTYQAFLCPAGISWQAVHDVVGVSESDWHLATITSAEENTFVYDLLGDNPEFWYRQPGGNSEGPWLGGFSSCNSCNDWQWVTGEPWGYTNWAPIEPVGNGDALGFFGYQNPMSPRWNDIGKTVTRPRGYILECPESGNCPELDVDASCNVVSTESTSWGSMKARYENK
jgi:hypothetical protein